MFQYLMWPLPSQTLKSLDTSADRNSGTDKENGWSIPRMDTTKFQPSLSLFKGRRIIHVKQVPFSRSSWKHDDVSVVDIEIKIYQNIQHSRKDRAWDVVQCIEVKYQKKGCEIAVIMDCLIMKRLEVSLNIR